VELDSVIIFAPAGELVPLALGSVRKGGVVVCAGIHMSPVPQFEYELLWGERTLRSVANLTRRDGQEFLEIAARWHIQTEVQVFELEQANEALRLHKSGELEGTAVLVP
jgi:propanol-preferring alcohol dehydrogenase